ncbi:PAS domain-containing protein [Aliiglaciecola sp.]|nr:PAS domain-containing protein [Aliiglaciecola sp.]
MITLVAITAEENKTREITQLSERLKLAADSANLGIWDWDIKNDHLTWDDKMYHLYGIHRNDFDEVYDAWVSGIHPDDAERMDLHLKDALYTDIPFE